MGELGIMGQDIVIRILQDLGGDGTLGEITDHGKKHYPNSVRDRCQIVSLLYRMRRNFKVRKDCEKNRYYLTWPIFLFATYMMIDYLPDLIDFLT